MKYMCIVMILVAYILVSLCNGRLRLEIDTCGSNKPEIQAEVVNNDEVMDRKESTVILETVFAGITTESSGISVEKIPEEAFDLSDKSPMEALKAVLLYEAPFYCSPDHAYMYSDTLHEYRGYLDGLSWENSEAKVVASFKNE